MRSRRINTHRARRARSSRVFAMHSNRRHPDARPPLASLGSGRAPRSGRPAFPPVALLILAATCGGGSGPKFSEVTQLSAATTVGTAPMFAVSPSGQETIAWVSAPAGGTDGRLYVSVAGAPPVEIRDSLGPIEAHGESPPKITYAHDGALYAVYTVGRVVPGARFPLSALRLVKSSDDGRTWSSPVTVTTGEVFGSHSFHALHAASDGTIYVSWLGSPPPDTSKTVAMQPSMMSMASMQHEGSPSPAHGAHGP